jgi:hypothetical protein
LSLDGALYLSEKENADLRQQLEASRSSDINMAKKNATLEIWPQDANARIAELTAVLERIANREGHYFYPDVSGPDERGMFTVIGPGKPQLTKQCAHWMRSIARKAMEGQQI